MALKAILESLDGVDATLQEHYKLDDKTGKYHLDLTDVDGLPRVVSLKNEAAQNRIKVRELTTEVTGYKALGTLDEVQTKLDKYPELEALAATGGKIDDKKLDQLVETRIVSRLAPLERERDTLKTQLGEVNGVVETFKAERKQRMIGDAVRSAAAELKVTDSAIEDAIMYGERVFDITDDGKVITKDNSGVVPGLEPKAWLTDMQQKRPHWWGPSQGGGAPGSRGNMSGVSNPFSHESWNMTEQAQLVRSDRARAEQLAKAAGTTLGGPRPAPKK